MSKVIVGFMLLVGLYFVAPAQAQWGYPYYPAPVVVAPAPVYCPPPVYYYPPVYSVPIYRPPVYVAPPVYRPVYPRPMPAPVYGRGFSFGFSYQR